jgi:uncharacterized protein (TIGR03067 family)
MTKRTALILALAMLSFSCRRPNQPTPAVSPPAVVPPDQARPAALPTAPTGDLELLVGKWNIVRAVADGEGYTASYRRAKFEIAAGSKYMFALPGLVKETGTITIDPKKNPKELDMNVEDQPANQLQPSIDVLQGALGNPRQPDDRRVKRVPAIYKLDGDDLMICLSMLGNRRPTDFETTKDSWRVLMTCKRMKPADQPKDVTAKAPLPQPLPQEVQQAWVKAGAEVGWMGKKDDHVTLDFRTTPDALIDAVPAFRFKDWKEGTVARLPVPKTPFGLDLSGTEATDADLKGLEALETLSALDLAFTKLTDAGLKNLSGLKLLSVLNLFATKVTDVGLKELASLNSLHTLDLRVLDITDVGLKELARQKNLKTLDLTYTKITDVGLKELARLSSLQHLDLVKTQVTDTGLKELTGMSSLRYLDLADTRVTDAGVKELKQALPNCQILD